MLICSFSKGGAKIQKSVDEGYNVWLRQIILFS